MVEKGVFFMPFETKTAEIITELKRVREEEGFSCARIVELVEQNGGSVSLSTVKRVFEDGSESYGWQYENTLKPIAAAVLGAYGSVKGESENAAGALKSAILDYKAEKIAALQAQIERMEASYARRLDFLTAQIGLKDARIDRLHGIIERMIDALLPNVQKGSVPNVPAPEFETGRSADLSAKVEN